MIYLLYKKVLIVIVHYIIIIFRYVVPCIFGCLFFLFFKLTLSISFHMRFSNALTISAFLIDQFV